MQCFVHDSEFGIINAPALSDTIIAALLPLDGRTLSTTAIAAACHKTLVRFDETAAAQYALAHHIVTLAKRRRKSA